MSGSPHPLLRASKVIAVHLNYASRAEERGRTPIEPSYFLKPPSSLSVDGAPVIRQQGCELLAYEGEVAIVIGAPARNVSPEEALRHIASVTAANDFGAYDFRSADRGSNVLAKGHDGYTPIGPVLVPASELDLRGIVLRTLVNGEVVQEDTTANLLFAFDALVADLSRFMTLEEGDVILTGTPANSRPVAPGDVVSVEVEGVGRITNTIAEAEHELPSYGAMPHATPADRAMALGTSVPRPVTLTPAAVAALRRVSTATLTVQLRRRGIRDTFLADLRPTRPDLRLLGYAHTLRYVPAREDVITDTELNAQKRAVETIGPDDVLVIDARGEPGAGTIGDILALRALRRGAVGIVTDGGLRDTPAVTALDIPTYHRSSHAAVLGLRHHPLESNVPVACAGVLVMPGDVMVGDADGVLVLPAALAEAIARDALEQERREQFAYERVDAGESIVGLFPLSDDRIAEFEAWKTTSPEDGA